MKICNNFKGFLTIFRNNNFLRKMSHKNGTPKHEISKHILSQSEPNLTLDFLTARCRGLKFQVLPTPVQSESDKKEYK